MSDRPPKPQELMMTQAETVPPPDVTVPEPPGPGADPQVLAEVKQLAHRVGGLRALLDLVDALIRGGR